ncbi:MAG TPA: two-component regulator propeller domain-containing protein [Cytophagales bacterium]|nr:two-component regulator propeller domain-containing protein [Cytophagales bacterium]
MKNILVVLLITLTHFLNAQSNFVFDHINSEQGLSNNGVSAILQDKKGLMWIGTFNGLNRYNGYEIKTYFNNPLDSNSIGDNRITCMLEDRKGNLWIGTHQGGLNLYNRDKDNFIHFSTQSKIKISSNTIECLFEDKEGNIWIGTNFALNMYNPTTHRIKSFYNTPNKPGTINSNQIYSIVDDGGVPLILTNNEKLNRYNLATKQFDQFSLADSLRLQTARFLYRDKKQNLWIGTLDEGLIKIRGNNVQSYTTKTGLNHNLIKSILEDNESNIWIGTDGGGVNILDPKTGKITQVTFNPESKNGLKSDAIYSLFLDRAGTIWVGTFSAGINIYNKQNDNFRHFNNILNNKSSLSNNSVLSILEDKKGKIWVGTDGGGLNLFNKEKGTFTHFKNDPESLQSLSSNVIKSLYEDRSGNLWIGTYLGGLNLLNKKKGTFSRFLHDPEDSVSIGGNIIWSICEDSKGNLWVSTLGNGVSVLNKATSKFKRFKPLSGDGTLGDYNIFSILEDSDKQIWLATENNGLNLFNPSTETFTYFQHDPKTHGSISSNHVFVLFEDSRKNLWVGTAGGGLNLMNKERSSFKAFTEKDGLPSNIILGITEDKNGFLWISTGKGLSKFDPVKETFKNYHKEDGLQSNEFNINSVCRSATGELYFGGSNGFNLFDPAEIKVNTYVPPVILSDFKIFNKSVKIGEKDSILTKQIAETKAIEITYREAVFSFEFAALNYISPSQNQYAYQLEGFDKGWNNSGNKREVTYTNLDAGTYLLKVKGANNDGLWNDVPTTLTLTIVPPWWNTLWFRLSSILVLITATIAFYKARTYHIRKTMKLERLRELKIKEAEMREEKLKHEKTVIELRKNQLESEVNYQNSKLASSVMNVVKQNETLLNIKDHISGILKENEEPQQKKNLRRIIRLIDEEVKPDQNWTQFEQLFNQLHENFLQRLKEKYPELTSRDLKLCAYLRMNLNSKEIAPLIGVSVRGVEDMRYRIRKKMDLDTSENLAEFILSF